MPYSDELDVRVTDTSLRDGSHAKRHQFTEDQVRSVVRALDGAGMPVIEVTHGDNCHQIWPVPVPIEIEEGFPIHCLDNSWLADRKPLRVEAVMKKDGNLFILQTSLGASARAPLFNDHAAFLINLRGVKTDIVRPVLEHLKGFLHHLRICGRNLQLVNCFIE